GERPFNGVSHSLCLGGAAGQKENSLCFEDGADAHGDGALGNLFISSKEFAVVFDGLLAENFQTGSRAQAGSRFVESYMAVASDAENLEVESAGFANRLLVGGAVLLIVSLDGAVGEVNVARCYVHVGEEILLHETVK